MLQPSGGHGTISVQLVQTIIKCSVICVTHVIETTDFKGQEAIKRSEWHFRFTPDSSPVGFKSGDINVLDLLVDRI